MTTINDILPLGEKRILVLCGKDYCVKRICNALGGKGSLTTHLSVLHGSAVKSLKRHGYKFLEETAWPWNASGQLEGKSPSSPQ